MTAFSFFNITLVKTVINWVNLIHIGILGENGKDGFIFGSESHHQSKTKQFFLKTVSKIMLVSFIHLTLVKNVINERNLVKIAYFRCKWS